MAASAFFLLTLSQALCGHAYFLRGGHEPSGRELHGFASVIEADRTIEAFEAVEGPVQQWVNRVQNRFAAYLAKAEPAPHHSTLSGMSLRELSLVSAAELAISMFLWLVVVVLAAYYYDRSVLVDMEKVDPDPKVDVPVFQDFDTGLFECFHDVPVCMWSTFFPSVTWAANMSISGNSGLWPACLFFCFLHIAGAWASHLGVGIMIWALLCAVCAYYRHKMRYTYKMEEQGLWAYSKDCMAYLCCTCCAISQESRHLQVALNKLKKANLQANAQLD